MLPLWMEGMTSANMQLTTIKVELEEGDELKEPEQHLDEGEFVEKRIVALKDLYQTLLGNSSIRRLPVCNADGVRRLQ